MSKIAYYARPINLFGTLVEECDIWWLEQHGYTVIDITTVEMQAAYHQRGMKVFKKLVKSADLLFFRACPDGRIPAGVYKEIKWAMAADVNLMESPGNIHGRAMSVLETREYLEDVGAR